MGRLQQHLGGNYIGVSGGNRCRESVKGACQEGPPGNAPDWREPVSGPEW